MDRLMRIAFLSEHASPVAILGGADAGGQNVYVDEVSRNLARRGYAVDVFTRCDNPLVQSSNDAAASCESPPGSPADVSSTARRNPGTPEIIDWAPGVRVVH